MGTATDLHVVFGAGQVGRILAAELVGRGDRVLVVSRSKPADLPEPADWRHADAAKPDSATEASEGAAVIYQCLNAPYDSWPELFPPRQRGVLAAAEQNTARLVTLENLYGYGQTGGEPMTEDLPLAATTVKGRVRAEMTRELIEAHEAGRVELTIGRASDFFGPGVTESALGERVFARMIDGKTGQVVGDPSLPHSYSYVPDVARGLATLGEDDAAIGEIWHLPVAPATSTDEIAELIGEDLGTRVKLKAMSNSLMWLLSLFNPTIRSVREMVYEFEEPFIVDCAKFEAKFGISATPMFDAIGATVHWYQHEYRAT